MKKRYFILCGVCVIISLFFLIYQGTTYFMVLSKYFLGKDTFNKLGYKAKINTHTTSYIN